MFVTSFIFAKKLPTESFTDLVEELDIILSQEWLKNKVEKCFIPSIALFNDKIKTKFLLIF